MNLIFEVIGWVGASALLTTYLLLSINIFKSQSIAYQGLNLMSSILLLINAFYIKSYPFVLINAVWSLIAVVALFRLKKNSEP